MSDVSEVVMAVIGLAAIVVSVSSVITASAVRWLTQAHKRLARKVGRLPCVVKSPK